MGKRPASKVIPAALLAAAALAVAAVSLAAPAFVDKASADIRHPPTRVAQWRQITAQVAAMPRTHARAGDVWFVGFAGFGEQRVFRKEAELAGKVFGARYDAASRALLLVNDVDDRRSYPLATYDNMRYAVRQVSRRMDLQHDTLVLVLTSHGNDTDGIAITNGRLPEDALSPKDVRKILDESHIRWRVVVVSACYSGIFIPVLKSDTTLVMTAADSHHSSFGCDDTRELTWFGEALLKDSLPQACSLTDAYRDMAALIKQRETEAEEIHSNPRLFEGARIANKLRELDAANGRSCAVAEPHRAGPNKEG